MLPFNYIFNMRTRLRLIFVIVAFISSPASLVVVATSAGSAGNVAALVRQPFDAVRSVIVSADNAANIYLENQNVLDQLPATNQQSSSSTSNTTSLIEERLHTRPQCRVAEEWVWESNESTTSGVFSGFNSTVFVKACVDNTTAARIFQDSPSSFTITTTQLTYFPYSIGSGPNKIVTNTSFHKERDFVFSCREEDQWLYQGTPFTPYTKPRDLCTYFEGSTKPSSSTSSDSAGGGGSSIGPGGMLGTIITTGPIGGGSGVGGSQLNANGSSTPPPVPTVHSCPFFRLFVVGKNTTSTSSSSSELQLLPLPAGGPPLAALGGRFVIDFDTFDTRQPVTRAISSELLKKAFAPGSPSTSTSTSGDESREMADVYNNFLDNAAELTTASGISETVNVTLLASRAKLRQGSKRLVEDCTNGIFAAASTAITTSTTPVPSYDRDQSFMSDVRTCRWVPLNSFDLDMTDAGNLARFSNLVDNPLTTRTIARAQHRLRGSPTFYGVHVEGESRVNTLAQDSTSNSWTQAIEKRHLKEAASTSSTTDSNGIVVPLWLAPSTEPWIQSTDTSYTEQFDANGYATGRQVPLPTTFQEPVISNMSSSTTPSSNSNEVTDNSTTTTTSTYEIEKTLFFRLVAELEGYYEKYLAKQLAESTSIFSRINNTLPGVAAGRSTGASGYTAAEVSVFSTRYLEHHHPGFPFMITSFNATTISTTTTTPASSSGSSPVAAPALANTSSNATNGNVTNSSTVVGTTNGNVTNSSTVVGSSSTSTTNNTDTSNTTNSTINSNSTGASNSSNTTTNSSGNGSSTRVIRIRRTSMTMSTSEKESEWIWDAPPGQQDVEVLPSRTLLQQEDNVRERGYFSSTSALLEDLLRPPEEPELGVMTRSEGAASSLTKNEDADTTDAASRMLSSPSLSSVQLRGRVWVFVCARELSDSSGDSENLDLSAVWVVLIVILILLLIGACIVGIAGLGAAGGGACAVGYGITQCCKKIFGEDPPPRNNPGNNVQYYNQGPPHFMPPGSMIGGGGASKQYQQFLGEEDEAGYINQQQQYNYNQNQYSQQHQQLQPIGGSSSSASMMQTQPYKGVAIGNQYQLQQQGYNSGFQEGQASKNSC